MTYFIDLLISGITKGSIYALIALGYTMVYGIIGLINFAHGEVYMLGAFAGLVAMGMLELAGISGITNLIIAIGIAAAYCGVAGYSIEKVAYNHLRASNRLSPLISAIGMSIFLQNFVLIGKTSKQVSFPANIPELEFLESLPFAITTADLTIIVATIAVMIGLTFFIKFTKVGLAMRAVSQDTKMAQLIGVNVNRIISSTFILGSALGAIGALLIASSVEEIHFYMGFIAGLKAFTAAVLGGIGSIPGAVLGAYVLGLVESFGAGYISSDYEDVFAFTILVVILIFKPSGLLGRHVQEKV